MSVTPGRKTVLILDPSEVTLGRRDWTLTRSAKQIAVSRRTNRPASAPKSSNVFFVGGDAWILKPKQFELAQVVRAGVGGDLQATDGNLAPGFRAAKMWQVLKDVGIQASTALLGSGFAAFIKGVVAGSDRGQYQLAADLAAFPQPADEIDPAYPLDRVFAGIRMFAPNAAYQLRWGIPMRWEGSDHALTFYYGGPADVSPAGQVGGLFALAIRGSGTATLYEWDSSATPSTWRKRYEFAYAEPHAETGSVSGLSVIPYGRDRTAFLSADAGFVDSGHSAIGALVEIAILAITARFKRNVFRDLKSETGHSHDKYATGGGTVRVDVRRDRRVPFSIIHLSYPSLAAAELPGLLVDAPFVIPFDLPAGTPITLHPDAYLPDPTCTVVGALYDADTDAQLAADANGAFLSNAGQRKYYARFTVASADGVSTPALWSYTVSAPGLFVVNTSTPVVVPVAAPVDLSGPGIDPTQEHGSLKVHDLSALYSILQTRDRVRCLVAVTDVNLNVVSYLMEGETLQSERQLRGHPGFSFPSPNWADYDVRLTGLWPRIVEQFAIDPVNYSRDTAAPTNPKTGEQPPWKVTDILRNLLNNAGFRDDELDIPDLAARLWTSIFYTAGAEDYILQYGQDYATAIRRLSWDYLRRVLVRDPNAGPRGMWRLLLNPGPPYSNFLASFLLDKPNYLAGKLPHFVGSYPAGTTYIRHGTYTSWVKAPEVNLVVARGVSPSGAIIEQGLFNQNSMVKGHPDYIGRVVPAVFPPDASLTTQDAVNDAARSVYDYAAHAQKWAGFEAPLILVTDLLDTHQVRARPLRINDLVLVAGLPFLIRTARLNYQHDFTQWYYIEGMFLN